MSAPRILVVDDQPINVKLLERKLSASGMDVATAFSGEEALRAAGESPPDIVLLDIMMPGMDGMEVCRRLKANPRTAQTPILFITAKASKEGKIAGLEAGAADYITKPIDLDETLARIQTQLRIEATHRENLRLQQRLGEARQSAAVGAIAEGITHNLNNLLGIVVGYLDLLKSAAENPDTVRRAAGLMEGAIKRIVRIVQQLGSVATAEPPKAVPCVLSELIEGALDRLRETEGMAVAQINLDLEDPGVVLHTSAELFEDILSRLLQNAYEAYPDGTEADARAVIVASETSTNGHLRLRVRDLGAGLEATIADHVFEPFVSRHSAVGRGMGLAIARQGIRHLGGEITLRNHPEGGAEALLTHPLCETKTSPS